MEQGKQAKYGLFGKLKAIPSRGDELASILLGMASRLIATAKGCHIYIVSQDTQDNTVVWINEVWDTKANHDASLTITGVKELIGRALPLLEAKPEPGMTLRILGGKGLD